MNDLTLNGVPVSAEQPACWGCWYYSGQFSHLCGCRDGSFCRFYRDTPVWVDADHYCKRFTVLHPETPRTWDEVLARFAQHLEDLADDERDGTIILMDWVADTFDEVPDALRHHFGDSLAWEWAVKYRIIPETGTACYGLLDECDEYLVDGGAILDDIHLAIGPVIDALRSALTPAEATA